MSVLRTFGLPSSTVPVYPSFTLIRESGNCNCWVQATKLTYLQNLKAALVNCLARNACLGRFFDSLWDQVWKEMVVWWGGILLQTDWRSKFFQRIKEWYPEVRTIWRTKPALPTVFEGENIKYYSYKTIPPQRAPRCTCQRESGPVLYGSLAALTQEHAQQSGSTETDQGTKAGFHW